MQVRSLEQADVIVRIRRDRQPGREGRQEGIQSGQKSRIGKQERKGGQTARTGRGRREESKRTINGFLFLLNLSS
jgi:hypothetical protein